MGVVGDKVNPKETNVIKGWEIELTRNTNLTDLFILGYGLNDF